MSEEGAAVANKAIMSKVERGRVHFPLSSTDGSGSVVILASRTSPLGVDV